MRRIVLLAKDNLLIVLVLIFSILMVGVITVVADRPISITIPIHGSIQSIF